MRSWWRKGSRSETGPLVSGAGAPDPFFSAGSLILIVFSPQAGRAREDYVRTYYDVAPALLIG